LELRLCDELLGFVGETRGFVLRGGDFRRQLGGFRARIIGLAHEIADRGLELVIGRVGDERLNTAVEFTESRGGLVLHREDGAFGLFDFGGGNHSGFR